MMKNITEAQVRNLLGAETTDRLRATQFVLQRGTKVCSPSRNYYRGHEV